MALTEMEILQQAVESTEPKEIFKKVLRRRNDEMKRKLINILSVDVQKVEPIYIHQHMKYTRRYAENMFIFLDKHYKVMGLLKGNKWDSNWESAEDYEKVSRNRYYNRVEKTKKYLWEHAYHILMFDKKDFIKLNVNVSYNKNEQKSKRQQTIDNASALKRSLQERFFQYKCNKYKHISHDYLLGMISQVISTISSKIIKDDSIFINDIKVAFEESFGRRFHYHYNSLNAIDCLEIVIDKVRELNKNHKDYSMYPKESYYEKKYFESKLEIIKFYHYFFKIG